jgi:hypothetical protein
MTRGLIANCVFAFSCPRRWEGLAPTEDPDTRYCHHCERHVHLCRNEADFTRHANGGHCVAVPTAPRFPRRMIVGMPGPGPEPEYVYSGDGPGRRRKD